MKAHRKFSWLALGVILGAVFPGRPAPLPDGWEVKNEDSGTHSIKNYPTASGKTKSDYEILRKKGMKPAAVVFMRCKDLHTTLSEWVQEGRSGHYIVTKDGEIFQWIDEANQSIAAEALKNHVITVLAETPEGLNIRPGTEKDYTVKQILENSKDQALNLQQLEQLGSLMVDIQIKWDAATGQKRGEKKERTIKYLDHYWHAGTYQNATNSRLNGEWSTHYISNINVLQSERGLSKLTRFIVQQWKMED